MTIGEFCVYMSLCLLTDLLFTVWWPGRAILHPVSLGIHCLKNLARINHLACIYLVCLPITCFLGPCTSLSL